MNKLSHDHQFSRRVVSEREESEEAPCQDPAAERQAVHDLLVDSRRAPRHQKPPQVDPVIYLAERAPYFTCDTLL